MTDVREKAAVLALVRATEGKWHLTAALIEDARSAVRLLERDWPRDDAIDLRTAERLVARVTPQLLAEQAELVQRLEHEGVNVITVLDEDYPANLRDVYNHPPMLFVKGGLREQDERSVAVVGTRSPSPAGLREARSLAGELARRGVTVLSGLAHGIDTAAHEAALAAGGRTVSVMGTGIRLVYPPENTALADRIRANGALVSQFWPDAPPTRYSFPMRNVVMSGMAIGTAVVEAGPTSGARMQARLALEHGKRLFLIESLVSTQAWARRYAERPGAIVVRSANEIIDLVEALVRPAEELTVG